MADRYDGMDGLLIEAGRRRHATNTLSASWLSAVGRTRGDAMILQVEAGVDPGSSGFLSGAARRQMARAILGPLGSRAVAVGLSLANESKARRHVREVHAAAEPQQVNRFADRLAAVAQRYAELESIRAALGEATFCREVDRLVATAAEM